LKYNFLDENLDRFYNSEERWSNIVGWAGGISIFLACLGLLGLAALAVANRTKEIGIRKVLGASLSTIIQLLSKDFLKLVMILKTFPENINIAFLDMSVEVKKGGYIKLSQIIPHLVSRMIGTAGLGQSP